MCLDQGPQRSDASEEPAAPRSRVKHSTTEPLIQRRRFLKVTHRYMLEIGHVPGGHVFRQIKFVLAIFVEGHPFTISTKYFEF